MNIPTVGTAEAAWSRIIPFLRPIEPLIRDPEISDIMINGERGVFFEKHGRLERLPDVTIPEKSLQVAARNIARSLLVGEVRGSEAFDLLAGDEYRRNCASACKPGTTMSWMLSARVNSCCLKNGRTGFWYSFATVGPIYWGQQIFLDRVQTGIWFRIKKQ